MSDEWTAEENEALVASYLGMLTRFLVGTPFNKAAEYRALGDVMGTRRVKSIEKKHQNVSAVMIELGQPWIKGLAPLRNYQKQLATIVASQLEARPALQELCSTWIDGPAEVHVDDRSLSEILTDPPTSSGPQTLTYPAVSGNPLTPKLTNWLEREARSRSLGTAGELYALSFEHKRLWEAGQKSLAGRLEHVSVSRGDGLGYDIQSYEENGADRLIEVKTTRLGIETPFFASRNEVGVSGARAAEYVVYRLYSFDAQPKMYHLHGALAESCNLDAVSFEARPR